MCRVIAPAMSAITEWLISERDPIGAKAKACGNHREVLLAVAG
jgi:hypothetical protein